MKSSNVLRRNYDKLQQYAGSKSFKYKFIKNLLMKTRSRRRRRPQTSLSPRHEGSGLMNYSQNKLDYVYWDDPNELVDRQRAGCTISG